MESIGGKVTAALRLQLVVLSLTWLAGINVNGFVAIIPGTGAGEILLNSSVGVHVVLAVLSAAIAVFIFALAWVGGSRRVAVYSFLAVLSLVAAGYSGVSFVLGGGSSPAQSMSMATAFVFAIFLTFLALANTRSESEGSAVRSERVGPYTVQSGAISLVLFFGVLLSGMYVNLYVAGPVYSLPLAKQAAAFTKAEGAAGFLGHEALGALLLLALLAFAVSIRNEKGYTLPAFVAFALVAYSAYVGSLNLSTKLPSAPVGQGTELFSSLGLMVALVVTMLLVARVRSDRSPWYRRP